MRTTTSGNQKYVPKNYYCHFTASLKEDLGKWTLNVYRYYSIYLLEVIDLVVTSSM